MTSPAGAIALCLLLCCARTWAHGYEAHKSSESRHAWFTSGFSCFGAGNHVKPGQCPHEVDNPSCSSTIPDEMEKCTTDQDCEGKKKCCLYKCSHRCLLPLEDKTDSCPLHNATRCMTMRPLPSSCHDDKQCQGSERCCCYNCNYHCVPTVKVKPGQCPPKPKKCPLEVPNNCAEQDKGSKKKIQVCETDMNCTGTKKCCDSCRNECVTPIKERSGFCPVRKEPISCGTILKEPFCHSDADCKLKDKCCLADDHMKCVTALKEKNWVCPPPPEMCTMKAEPDKCDGDQDCIDDKKCCKSVCIKQCVSPIKTPQKRVKREACPPMRSVCDIPQQNSECSSQCPCSDNKKCCYNGCYMECIKI